jgi:hypothetical protein
MSPLSCLSLVFVFLVAGAGAATHGPWRKDPVAAALVVGMVKVGMPASPPSAWRTLLLTTPPFAPLDGSTPNVLALAQLIDHFDKGLSWTCEGFATAAVRTLKQMARDGQPLLGAPLSQTTRTWFLNRCRDVNPPTTPNDAEQTALRNIRFLLATRWS